MEYSGTLDLNFFFIKMAWSWAVAASLDGAHEPWSATCPTTLYCLIAGWLHSLTLRGSWALTQGEKKATWQQEGLVKKTEENEYHETETRMDHSEKG